MTSEEVIEPTVVESSNNIEVCELATFPGGMHGSKTVAQVLCVDPDYPYWAKSDTTFSDRVALMEQLRALCRLGRNIKLPPHLVGKKVAYTRSERTGKLINVSLVDAADAPYMDITKDVLDLGLARELAGGKDRSGGKLLGDFLRNRILGGGKITRERCNAFFADIRNFADPKPQPN